MVEHLACHVVGCMGGRGGGGGGGGGGGCVVVQGDSPPTVPNK